MHSPRHVFCATALACLAALGAPRFAVAQSAPSATPLPDCSALAAARHAEFDPRAAHGGAFGRGPAVPEEGHGFGPPLPPFLRGLTLSDEQQDRLFAIHHELEPALRQQARAAARASERLRELAASDGYDEAAARSLAEAGARAQAELALLRARADHEMLQALSPEQRKQAAAARACGPGADGPHAPWF